MNILDHLIDFSLTIRCRYPKLGLGQRQNYDRLTTLDQIRPFLENPKNDGDCSGVLWLMLLHLYLSDDKLKIRDQVANYKDPRGTLSHFLQELPNSEFHLYFPRQYNIYNQGTLYYLRYVAFYDLFSHLETGRIPLNTNHMGYWCLCLGIKRKINHIPGIEKLFYGITDQNNHELVYLVFWGQRGEKEGEKEGVMEGVMEGKGSYQDSSTMAIVNITCLMERLKREAKRDWTLMLEKSQDSGQKQSIQSLADSILAKQNHTFESLKLEKLGCLFQKKHPLLNICRFYQHAAKNIKV